MSKIIGNTTATPMAIPDWKQTDENKADYIKNKPSIVDEIVRANGGMSLGYNVEVFYYSSFWDAVDDINGDDLSGGSIKMLSDSICAVYYDKFNSRYALILLDDITASITHTFDVPVEVNFAGKFITFPKCENETRLTFGNDAYLNGQLGGGVRGQLGGAEKQTDYGYPIRFNGNVVVDGGSYTLDGGAGHPGTASVFYIASSTEKAVIKNIKCSLSHFGTGRAIAILSYGQNLTVDNVAVDVNGTPDVDAQLFYGLYCDGSGEMNVMNSHITAQAQSKATKVYGMYFTSNSKCANLENNVVYVDASNNDVDTTKGKLGVACYVNDKVKKAVIKGGDYTGTHTAISLCSDLAIIDGGRFVSCAHGGFYYSKDNGKCYVKNAMVGTASYSGIFDQSEMGNTVPLGSFYVGGKNSVVHMDNCEFLYTDDTKYAGGVLRDDINASLYVSNVTIPDGHKLRVDDGCHVYIGVGTNITKDNLCSYMGAQIADASFGFTGDNVYTYENYYAQQKSDALKTSVDTINDEHRDIGYRISVMEDKFGMHGKYREITNTANGSQIVVPENAKRFAKILKIWGTHGEAYHYDDYGATWNYTEYLPDYPQYISINSTEVANRKWVFPINHYITETKFTNRSEELNKYLADFGMDEDNYIYSEADKWFYHQGVRYYPERVKDKNGIVLKSDELRVKNHNADVGYFVTLRNPVITDVTKFITSDQRTYYSTIDIDSNNGIEKLCLTHTVRSQWVTPDGNDECPIQVIPGKIFVTIGFET